MMDIENKNDVDGWELLTYANRYISNVTTPGNIFDTIESIDPMNTIYDNETLNEMNSMYTLYDIDTIDTMETMETMETNKKIKYKPIDNHYEDCFSDHELSDKNSIADSEDFEVNSDNEWVAV